MKTWMRLALSACMLAAMASAPAQQLPPLKIVHGFGAGGPPDVALRKIADRLAPLLGRSVVVENRPGASGTIAAASVAHAAPDGNVLLFGVAANLAIAPAALRPAPYDPVRDFTPITLVARGPYVLLVRADAPAGDFPQFLAWAKAQPGKLNYATPGLDSAHQIAMEKLQRETGLALVHVPYRTGLYPALLGGEVQVMFESLPGPLPFLSSGKLRALAVTGTQRLARLPDVPTLHELGVQSLDDVSSWWGFVAPPGLPQAQVEKFNAALRAAMGDPDLMATMQSWGIALTPSTPREFGELIALESDRARAMARPPQ